MRMMDKLKYRLYEVYYAWKEAGRTERIVYSDAYEADRTAANIIRLVHAIEKGLSIENPRPFFGQKKIDDIISMTKEYAQKYGKESTCVQMACEALLRWKEWHKENGFQSAEFENMACRIAEMADSMGFVRGDVPYAGTKTLSLRDIQFDLPELTRFFETRHSIRQFTGEKVDRDKLRAAIKLAQTAPSACNRQAVRVYSIDSKKYMEDLQADLSGIGGFAEDVDLFLLITGKLSAYGKFEHNQFIVSAGIFAGYLSLALHAYNIGACIIQRPTRLSAQWEAFAQKNGIPADEQIVCMIGIGSMKEETAVPVSNRLETDAIYRHLS